MSKRTARPRTMRGIERDSLYKPGT